MATSMTSDAFYEVACIPCAEEKINREAIVFCVNCNEFYCKQCYKFHNRVADSNLHKVIDQDDLLPVSRALNTTKKVDLPTEKCERHHGKLVDMYCENDDVIGCSVCMALGHRSCQNVFYIPDIAGTRITDHFIESTDGSLSKYVDELKHLKQNRINTKSRLATEKDACLKEVKERRKAIETSLDKAERSLCETILEKHDEFRAKLDTSVITLEDSAELLEKMRGKLRDSKGSSASQTFVNLKLSMVRLSIVKKIFDERRYNMDGLLTLVMEDDKTEIHENSCTVMFGRCYAGYKHPNSVHKEEEIDIRIKSDKNICKCCDLCELPDGTLVITDWKNKNIKSLKFDETYKLSEELCLFNSPWGVCCIKKNEVAVTIPDDRSVNLFTIHPSIVTKNMFRVESPCYGIACAGTNLYIGHHLTSRVNVYDLIGNLLQTFCKEIDKPLHLDICPIRQHLVVAGGRNGLIVLDMSGELVTTHTYPAHNWTYAACIDDSGNVYIADSGSKECVVLGQDNSMTSLICNLDKQPRAIYFNRRSRRLMIAFGESDHIQTYCLSD